MDEVRSAVDNAKQLLTDCGVDIDVSAEQLWDWFDTELPVPDIELGDVVIDPLLVVHELVEIDEVLKMGLKLTKDVIIKNPEKLDDAHIKAAEIELMVAKSIGAVDHIESRIKDMERWCVEGTLSELREKEYRQLLVQAKDYLRHLRRSRI
jgi:hypothetical protein